MDDKYIKYGGRIGVAIAFVMVLIPPGLQLCIHYIKDSGQVLDELYIFAYTLWAPIFLISMIGNFLGKKAAENPNVHWAMVKGGFYAWLFTFISTFPLYIIYFCMNLHLVTDTNLIQNWIPIYFFLLLIMICLGAIHGGLTAIYVRDYRQIQRLRLIPQFNLQELLIIFSLLTVFFSALATIAVLPGLYG